MRGGRLQGSNDARELQGVSVHPCARLSAEALDLRNHLGDVRLAAARHRHPRRAVKHLQQQRNKQQVRGESRSVGKRHGHLCAESNSSLPGAVWSPRGRRADFNSLLRFRGSRLEHVVIPEEAQHRCRRRVEDRLARGGPDGGADGHLRRGRSKRAGHHAREVQGRTRRRRARKEGLQCREGMRWEGSSAARQVVLDEVVRVAAGLDEGAEGLGLERLGHWRRRGGGALSKHRGARCVADSLTLWEGRKALARGLNFAGWRRRAEGKSTGNARFPA